MNKLSLNVGEGPEPDDDQETCENCRKKFDIESMTLMEDCWFCKDCTADWQKHFDACDHEWEPRGDDEKLCRKCSGVVRVDVTEPSSPSASGRSQPAPEDQLRGELERLKSVLKWTDEVYPARIEAGGAGIEITWDEYNAMRAAAGFRPVKRINDEEGRAGFNHRLRARVTASEALLTEAVERCAKVAESCLVKFSICKSGILQDQIDIARKDIAAAIRSLRG